MPGSGRHRADALRGLLGGEGRSRPSRSRGGRAGRSGAGFLVLPIGTVGA